MQDMLGHDIPVGIATRYGLDDSGPVPMWGEEILRLHASPHRPWDPPSHSYIGNHIFFLRYSGWGVALMTNPHLALMLRMAGAALLCLH